MGRQGETTFRLLFSHYLGTCYVVMSAIRLPKWVWNNKTLNYSKWFLNLRVKYSSVEEFFFGAKVWWSLSVNIVVVCLNFDSSDLGLVRFVSGFQEIRHQGSRTRDPRQSKAVYYMVERSRRRLEWRGWCTGKNKPRRDGNFQPRQRSVGFIRFTVLKVFCGEEG